MKRREFLATSAGCACFLLAKTGMATTATTVTTKQVKIGDLKSLNKDGFDNRWVNKHGFFIVRRKDRIFAMSALCTHDRTSHLNSKPGVEKLVCPRHGAQFAQDGSVVHPPAKRNLAHFAIKVDDKGQVVVDTSKPIDQDNWDDDGMFIKLS